MIKIRLLKNHAGRKKGESISVKKNEAHALIERGVATIKIRQKRKKRAIKKYRGYADKMITPQRYKRR